MPRNWNKIRNIQRIDTNGQYFIIQSKRFYSCKEDGSALTYYPEIHAPARKTAFLPNNMVLVDGGTDRMYHLVSLEDRKTVLSKKAPGNRWMAAREFAVSLDGKIAFDHWEHKGTHYLVRIDTQSLEFKMIPLCLELRLLADFAYIDSNQVYVLLTQSDMMNGNSIGTHIVSSILLQDDGYVSALLHKWTTPTDDWPTRTDGRFILTANFSILDLEKQEEYNLFENTSVPFLFHGRKFYMIKYYEKDKIMQVYDESVTQFIDCKMRKVIACYKTQGGTYSGCLKDNKFYWANESGIVIKDFPIIEQ